MIKFNFTLDDEDAQFLIDIINKEKNLALSTTLNGNASTIVWYKQYSEYLDQLKQKILAGNLYIKE
jgi:hypothetical protein